MHIFAQHGSASAYKIGSLASHALPHIVAPLLDARPLGTYVFEKDRHVSQAVIVIVRVLVVQATLQTPSLGRHACDNPDSLPDRLRASMHGARPKLQLGILLVSLRQPRRQLRRDERVRRTRREIRHGQIPRAMKGKLERVAGATARHRCAIVASCGIRLHLLFQLRPRQLVDRRVGEVQCGHVVAGVWGSSAVLWFASVAIRARCCFRRHVAHALAVRVPLSASDCCPVLSIKGVAFSSPTSMHFIGASACQERQEDCQALGLRISS